MSSTVDAVLYDCDIAWLDDHDAIVHWHNGHVYVDVRRQDGLRVQTSATFFSVAFARARELCKRATP